MDKKVKTRTPFVLVSLLAVCLLWMGISALVVHMSRYQTPEEAFNHSFTFKNVKLKEILEGDKTAMAIYSDNGVTTSRIFEKDERGWKKLSKNLFSPDKSAEYDEVYLDIRNYSGTNVISISDLKAGENPAEIHDSIGTVFQTYSIVKDTYTIKYWFAELEKLEDDYTVFINGNKIEFN